MQRGHAALSLRNKFRAGDSVELVRAGYFGLLP